MKNILIMLLIAFTYSGCSSKYQVTFDSNPQGAEIVCNGTNWGYSPTTLYYDEKVKDNTSLNLSSCSANWISGVTKQYGIIDLTQFPDGVRQTLQRPNVDGYDKDAQFALQVKTMKVQEKQAEAAKKQADDAFWQQVNYNNQQQLNRNAQYLRNLGY